MIGMVIFVAVAIGVAIVLCWAIRELATALLPSTAPVSKIVTVLVVLVVLICMLIILDHIGFQL